MDILYVHGAIKNSVRYISIYIYIDACCIYIYSIYIFMIVCMYFKNLCTILNGSSEDMLFSIAISIANSMLSIIL